MVIMGVVVVMMVGVMVPEVVLVVLVVVIMEEVVLVVLGCGVLPYLQCLPTVKAPTRGPCCMAHTSRIPLRGA